MEEAVPWVKVWIQRFVDRSNLMLQWIDPLTGKRKTRSTETDSEKEAERQRVVLEAKLNENYKKPFRPIDPLEIPDEFVPGFVYLVRNHLGHIKIGKAKNPRSRFSNLQTASSSQLELLHVIETNAMAQAESSLHAKFEKRRVRGEWFDLTPKQIEELLQRKTIRIPTWKERCEGEEAA